MKKRVLTFLSGVLVAVLVFGLSLSALAVNGTVTFNSVGLMVEGRQLAQAGEALTLDSGAEVPSVILYTDDQGGGTTYLPARSLAEALGVAVGWDAASGSVTVGGASAAIPTLAATPSATPIPTPSATPQPISTTVYITKTGKKYHRDGCRYLSRSKISLSLSDAHNQGYAPCSVCNPPTR